VFGRVPADLKSDNLPLLGAISKNGYTGSVAVLQNVAAFAAMVFGLLGMDWVSRRFSILGQRGVLTSGSRKRSSVKSASLAFSPWPFQVLFPTGRRNAGF
jgi:hypothetical protein